MAAPPRTGTLMLISRLSKVSMRAAPESLIGMSIRHYMALSCIADAGSIPQQQLPDVLFIDANNTVLVLNELEDAGLVRRERDPADRRRHVVTVTDAGLAKVKHARAARETVEDAVLGPLSAAEREQLHRLLAKALGDPPR